MQADRRVRTFQKEELDRVVLPLLLRNAPENNIMIGVVNAILHDNAALPDPTTPPLLACIEEQDGKEGKMEMKVAAIMTPPRALLVSHPCAVEDARFLAEQLFSFNKKTTLEEKKEEKVDEVVHEIREVDCEKGASEAFARRWAELSGRPFIPATETSRMHRTERVNWDACGGRSQLQGRQDEAAYLYCVPAEDELAVRVALEWGKEFAEYMGEPPSFGMSKNITHHIELKSLYMWRRKATNTATPSASTTATTDESELLSMACWRDTRPYGCRISMVFTPAHARGHGYATRLVAHLTQLLLDPQEEGGEGKGVCCIVTDVNNPTSNSIYTKIGYRPTVEFQTHPLAN